MKALIITILLTFLSACTAIPEGIKPIADFEVNRYVGKWHEIARLDNRYERGLDQITAE
jgi:apolipoprotein D and lipocalin family protein